MKLRILLLTVLIGLMSNMQAQVALYNFSQSSGTYTPITGGTVLGVPNNDDTSFPNNPIGFTFWYNGVAYTTFSVQSNGFIALGGAVASSYTAISSGGTNNIIAALNQDLQGDATLGNLRYETVGVAPNRTLVVQWTAYDDYQSVLNFDSYDFQIRLTETTNAIDVVYGTITKDPVTPADDFMQVGLRGNSNADFNNREVSALFSTWATSTAGAFNGATCELNPTLLPASGQTYSWISLPPAAPTTLTFSGVTSTGMTVNWIDNSTDEVNFQVYRSLDGINYTFAGTVPSVTAATTGTPYNLPQTGLFSNTLYYWQVYAVANTPSTPLSGTQATLPGTLCGTYTVGPTGAYASLTAAFADAALNGLACPCNFELQAAYVSSVETYPLNVPFAGAGAGASITVRPELGATNLSITNGTANTLVFNGSSFTTFDGRPGGVGVVRQLTIANTATGFSAANFVGDVTNCGLTYVNIQGVTTGTTNAVVTLGNAASIAGLTNLSITNSTFTDGASTPQQYIYSANATANSWTGMTVTNNTFEDWFSATGATNAINIGAGNRGWNISNNSFFQTATRTYTTANTHNIILVSTTTPASGGNTISNNNFGGNDALMAGSYTLNGAIASRLNVINASGNTSFANNTISGNTIKNFNLSTTSGATTSPGLFCGILAAGTTNNFNITNNIIGSNTNSDSIMVTTTTTGGISYGISVTATGTNIITGNQIGGFKLFGSTATVSTSFAGINVSSGVTTIDNNLIGSTTVNSNIRTALSTGTTAGRIDGIAVTGGTSSIVSNNTIAGITNFYNGTSTTGSLRGIAVTSTTGSITGNTINNLATLAVQINGTVTPTLAGIVRSGAFNGINVSNNTISNLYNLAASAANIVVTGITYSTTATLAADNTIHLNKISNLGAPLNTGAASVIGLDNLIGNVRVYNNFVDLGLDLTAASITAPNAFVGMSKSTTGSSRFLFNSVRIAGTGVNGGATNSIAFRRTAVGATDTVKANVFTNFRSNGASTGIHYVISLNNNTTITLDRNVYFGNGTGYVFGNYLLADITSLSAWSAATANDVNSFFADPNFISATDLHINGATPNIVESRASGVTSIVTDIDGNTRPGPIGSLNGGGTDPDIGADEVDAFPVTTDIGISLLVKPLTSGCHTTPDSVIVRLRNYASTSTINFALDNVTINSSVTGPNPVVFPTIVINSGTLAGGATLDVVVGLNYVMNALGTYTFNASAVTPLDFINSNDAMAPVNITISGGSSTANQATICAGATVNLTNVGATAGGSFQWQVSQNATSWTNVGGAITNPYTYTDASASPDTLYFRSLSCNADSSTIDTVVINYVLPATTIDTSRCGPGLLDIYASGSGLLNWFNVPTGGTSLDTGIVYTPFLNATDTFYVENSTGTAAGLHQTTYAAGNGSSGNVFTIKALNTITITNFDGHTSTTAPGNWEVWYRPNDYLLTPGSHLSNVGWTQLGTATGVPQLGTGVVTPIPINFSVTIPAGQTYSFQLFNNGSVNYTNGTLLGGLYNANLDLEVYQGHGGTAFAGMVNQPRVFNGRIHYTSGCAAARTPVIATVTAPPAITATSSSGTGICTGTSFDSFSTLTMSSPNPEYIYTWLPVAGLSSATGDTVTATPSVSTTYIVTANDTTTGCANYDTVAIAVSLAPQFTTSVSEDTICDGAVPVVLTATYGPTSVNIGAGTVQNSATTYPAPYGNWYWGARHQFLILASDLAAYGLTAGNITGLTFDVVTATGTPLTNFEIQMAPSALTSLAAFETTGFTVVYPATTFTPVAGINSHVFTAPFNWDGVSNIIVQTCFNNGSFTDNDVVNQTTTPYVSCVYYREDNTGVCASPLLTGTASQIPNMIFTKTSSFVNTWTPAGDVLYTDSLITDASPLTTTDFVFTSLDTVSGCFNYDTLNVTVLAPFTIAPFASPVIACANGGDTLVANANGGYGNYTYAWSDGLGNNDTATVFAIPFDVMIGVTVTDGCGSLTDSVLIDIVSPIAITSTDTAYCGPGSGFVLSSDVVGGNGVNTYSWTGGSVADTSVTGLVSTTTSYTVTVTDGCGSTDTDVSTVTINPLPVANLGADIVQVNPPAVLDAGAGFSSYLWSTSATSQTISVNANGQYIVTVTNSFGCSDSDTIQVTFTAGINNPDGTTATVSYYPNPSNGILNMNIQGFMGKELKMDVMDLEGRIIRNFVFGEVTESYVTQMDLSTLRAGTYMVVLYSGGDTYTHRIVITTNY
jgi:hypothetical protein